MAVLKANSPPPVLTPFSIKDIEVQAQTLMLRARRATEVLLAEAQREGEQLKAAAKAEGFAEGRQEGIKLGTIEGRRTGHDAALAEIKPQLAQIMAAISAMLTQLEASRNELEAAGIEEVVALSSAIARRVTKRQAATDPQVLIENLKEAMKLAVQAADVHIVLHPEQRRLLDLELPQLKMNWPAVKHIEIVEDASVGLGGCRVLTRHGEIDAQIEHQLDRVISDVSNGMDEKSNAPS